MSLEEAQSLERESAPIQEAAQKLIADYEQRRNGGDLQGVEV
jgi:hypothetical protein